MGEYFPLNFTQINVAAGFNNPSTIKHRNNRSFEFWEQALFHRLCSIIDIENYPKEWDGAPKNLFYYCLYKFGFLGIFDNKKFGFTFQPCTLYGISWYYQPTNIIVANPALQESLDMEIGKDCEVLRLTPDWSGAWNIIDYYAEKLSLMDVAVNVAIANSKYPFILGGKNKSAVTALKKIVDKVESGDPCVFYDTRISDNVGTGDDSPFQEWHNQQDYILSNLLQDFQTILNNFDTEIGIPTVPYQKKERMVQSEAESKETESVTRCTTWVNCLNDSFDLINKHFGKNMKAVLHFKVESEEEDESSKNNNDRSASISEKE